jgi:hypothetical protein
MRRRMRSFGRAGFFIGDVWRVQDTEILVP